MNTWLKTTGGKVTIWLLCIVSLFLFFMSGVGTAFLLSQNAYHKDLDNMQEDILQDSLQWDLREAANYAQISLGEVKNKNAENGYKRQFAEENTNFYFTVTDVSGKTLLKSDWKKPPEKSLATGTYYTKVVVSSEEKTIAEYYKSYAEAENAVEKLQENYSLIDWDIEDRDERGEVYLTARYLVQETQDITVTGAVRGDTMIGDQYGQLLELSRVLYQNRIAMAVICAVCGLIGIVSFILLLAFAGRRADTDEVVLSPLDRIPLELHTGGLLLAVGCGVSVVAAPISTQLQLLLPIVALDSFLCIFLLLLMVSSWAVRIRAKTLLKNTLTYRLFRPVQRGITAGGKKIGTAGHSFFEKLPLFWQAGVLFAGLCFLEGLCIIGMVAGVFFGVILWFLLKLAEAVLIVYMVLSLRTLQKGGRELSKGNLDYRTPLDNLRFDFREHGENLNHIRDGMEAAVQEQVKAERMKTELITNVSHDIKTPLTAIVSHVDLLKKEPMPSEEAAEHLAVLERQSARLKKLTEDLVEASKAATGNLTVERVRTEVNILLEQCAGEYTEKLAKKDLSLILTMAEGNPTILADGRLLWRIFENLLSNIEKYAQRGTRVYLTSETAGENVTITFRNISATPLNISAEELTERFVRGDASRNTEGSGLGLSIVQSLTRLQEGECSLVVDGDLFKAILSFPKV